MNARLTELRHRKAVFIAQCGRDRERLVAAAAPWCRSLAWVGRAAQGVFYLKNHPLLVAAAIAGFGLIRGRAGKREEHKAGALWRLAKPLLGIGLSLLRKP